MNSKIVIVIPFCKNDGAQAEQLCDWIYQLNDGKPKGHVLLVASGDTHPEMVTKVQIAAEVAFQTVTIFVESSSAAPMRIPERVNKLFRELSEFYSSHFNWPFLLLEPDAIPVLPDWMEQIVAAYEDQPKRFLGSFMQYAGPDKALKLCLARVGVYPANAAVTLKSFCGVPVPFNMVAGDTVIPMANKTWLIQQMEIKDVADLEKINPASVIVHGDKKGILLNSLQNPKTEGGAKEPVAPKRESNNPATRFKKKTEPAAVV